MDGPLASGKRRKRRGLPPPDPPRPLGRSPSPRPGPGPATCRRAPTAPAATRPVGRPGSRADRGRNGERMTGADREVGPASACTGRLLTEVVPPVAIRRKRRQSGRRRDCASPGPSLSAPSPAGPDEGDVAAVLRAVVSAHFGSVAGIWVSGMLAIVRGDGRLVDHCRTGIHRTRIPGRVRAAVHLLINPRRIMSRSSVVPVRILTVRLRRHFGSSRLGGGAAAKTYPTNRRTSPARARTSYVSASDVGHVGRPRPPLRRCRTARVSSSRKGHSSGRCAGAMTTSGI